MVYFNSTPDIEAVIGADDLLWLGGSHIQLKNNRTSPPAQLFVWRILQPSRTAHWGFSESKNRVLVGMNEGVFHDAEDVQPAGSASIQSNGSLNIPKRFFRDYKGTTAVNRQVPNSLQFDYTERIHFVSTGHNYDKYEICDVVKTDVARQIIAAKMGSERANSIFPPDRERLELQPAIKRIED